MWVPVQTSFSPWKMSQPVNIMFLPALFIVVSIFSSSEGLVPAKNYVLRLIEVVRLGVTFMMLIVVVRSTNVAKAPPCVVP